jgi:pilus assembly protein CpaE
MKIKVVSQSTERAEEMARQVRALGSSVDVQAAASPLAGLPTVINGSRPGLLVLDGVDAPGLDALARMAQAHPEIDTIIVSGEQSPAFLMKAMQAGVREVLPPPVSGPALQAAVQRLLRKRAPMATAPARNGEVFAFISCKGGSGATFLAANFAHLLSTRDERTVALIDLDLQFGDALLMLGSQRASTDVAEVARNIGRLDADLLRSSMVTVSDTLAVLPAPEELSQALEVKAEHVEAIVKQARQMFDFVVLDVGRAIDAMSLHGLDMSRLIFPVMQQSLPQLRDAKRLRALFRSLEYPSPKIHWIVNRHQKADAITLDAIAHALGSKQISTVPNHFASVSAAMNEGQPIERAARSGPVTKALRELVQAVVPAESTGKKDGWFASMFGNA